MSTEELYISDGTTLIDFFAENGGFHLADWPQAITGYKNNGTWQDSSLAEGRRLVDKRFTNGVETFVLRLNQSTDDGIHEATQNLFRLLEQATGYWTGNNSISPVYLAAKSSKETNTRYALIRGYRIEQLPVPYFTPFNQPKGRTVYEEIAVVIERGHWLSEIPGQSAAVSGSNSQAWEIEGFAAITEGAVPDMPAPTADYLVLAIGNSRVLVAPDDTGGTDDMYISTDQGDTWAAVTGGSNVQVHALIELANGDILISEAGSNQILRSTDQGDNVSVFSTDIGGGPIIQLANGDLLSTDASDDVYKSTDGGQNWTMIGTVGGGGGTIEALVEGPTTDTLIAFYEESSGFPNAWIYRSTDGGLTWSIVLTENLTDISLNPSGYQNLAVDNDGIFYLAAGAGSSDIFRSDDDGLTWFVVNNSLAVAPADVVFVDSKGILWVLADSGGGGDFVIYRSIDKGVNFKSVLSANGEHILLRGSFTESADGDFYAGGNGVFRSLASSSQDYGTATADRLDMVNHQKIAQLSHIFVDDGGVFGSNQFPVAASFNLLPATSVVNDAVYFGIQTSLVNNAPFCSLRFNISSGASSTTAYTITWEYYNGSWVTLTTQDNTAQFSAEGRNSVHWKQPSDWTGVAINSVTALWVRARVSAVTGTMTGPVQADEDIITHNINYIEIAAAQVGGDIPALSRLRLTNRSDGGEPDMAGNRYIAGLRSVDRGADFVAYLNAAGANNPDNVSVSYGSNVSSAADQTAASGDRATYAPGGVEAMAARVTFAISTVLAPQWYGVYHAFLRCRQINGSVGDFSVRVQVVVGSGGVTFTGGTVALTTTNDWQLIDLGRVEIAPGIFSGSEQGDQLELIVAASALSGTPDLYLYDLVLIPTDEWSCDFTDETNTSDSDVGEGELFDIDSLSFLKRDIRGVARKASNLIYSTYKPVANGKAVWQNNKRQRMWFLIGRYGAGGEWVSEPYDVYSLVLAKSQRYLAGRGGR